MGAHLMMQATLTALELNKFQKKPKKYKKQKYHKYLKKTSILFNNVFDKFVKFTQIYSNLLV